MAQKKIEKQVPPRRFTGSVFDAREERKEAEHLPSRAVRKVSLPKRQSKDPAAYRAEVLEG